MLLSRLTQERGVALPVALAVLMSAAGLATVAARSGIVSGNQSFRDKNAKRAMQAASAGIQEAVYQTNLLQPGTGKCVIITNPTTRLLSKDGDATSGWCTAQTEDLGDGAAYSMQVSNEGSPTTSSSGLPIVQRTVVSTGTVNGVKRRAVVTINAGLGSPMFPPGYAVAVRDAVDMKNNADINGHLGSNGTINLKNNADVCGNIKSGPGKTTVGQNLTQCAGYNRDPMTEQFDLQPVDLSGPTASNDNARLTNMKSTATPQPTPRDTCTTCNKITWSAATRVLTIDNNATWTPSGNTYLLCRLDFKGGTIQIPSGRTQPLKIFIDTPENCGGTTGMGSVVMDGTITNLSPTHALGILVAGSSTKATSVDLPTNGANSPIGVYAPNSTVVMKNNVQFTGAVVAKTLDVKNNAHFTWNTAVSGLLSGSNIRFYQMATGSYKECTSAAATSTPTNGC